ncbi:MAG: type VII secretion protein EssC [bacterium]
MKVIIVGENKLQNLNIPDFISETYTITFCDNNDVNKYLTFEKKDNVIHVISNDLITFLDSNGYREEVNLLNESFLNFRITGSDDIYEMYVFFQNKNYTYFTNDSSNTLLIGNESDNNILLDSNKVFKVKIGVEKNNYYFECDNKIFCNGRLLKTSKIFTGDILFINGIEIICMNKFFAIKTYNDNLVKLQNLKVFENTDSREYILEESNLSKVYSESELFYHVPRLREVIEIKKIVIDPPPEVSDKENIPGWVNSLTRVTMVTYSFIRGYNIYVGVFVNGDPWSEHIANIVLCLGMLVGSLIAPLVINQYKKKNEQSYLEKRIRTYTEYLNDRERIILNAINEQKQILLNENISAIQAYDTIVNKRKSFWSKRTKDDDFLNIRLGLGEISSKLEIDAPERRFTVEKDELLEKVYELKEKYLKVNNVPIMYSLRDSKLTAIISEASTKDNFINQIISQLTTTHSPLDLKILVYTNSENEYKWNYLKTVPHIFNDQKNLRFFVDNDEHANDVYNNFVEDIKKENSNKDFPKFTKKQEIKDGPYYLIFVDDYHKYKNDPLLNYVIKSKNKENSIFSIVIIDETMKNVPADCNNFIELGEDSGILLNSLINSDDHFSFLLEDKEYDNFKICARLLSSIPTAFKSEDLQLPSSLTFLNMHDVSKIEQLNIQGRWKNNDPVNSLSAIIGVHKNGDKFKLNLHEKNHGPHGLIAGSTGSGKSEFIITYILSMALEYHPYEVQFVLIDYKGGGLAGAFENKETKTRLPHLVGTITNLDISEMNRTLVSIRSEVKRRQIVFNTCREKLNESTVDIYKYQRFYRDGLVEEPMSHLFIVSDEFAELKSQRPEFMNEIISIARIGRSLGVHLILATQKPSGVVNDQIWSNSKFKVCLKVQNKSDSMEMLKRPEAASIKETGRFYLQVGYDEYFEIGQSGWTGAKYIPSDKMIQKIDKSLVFMNNVGAPIKTLKIDAPTELDNFNDNKDQLTNLVHYISELGKSENITVKNLWLDSIPDKIYIKDLYEKYSYVKENYVINPIIGEYDIPKKQEQSLLTINFNEEGNITLCGQSGSGKDKLLSTLIYSICTTYSPAESNLYIIDCSSQILKKFEKYPQVGCVLTSEDKDKLEDLLIQLVDVIEERKVLFINSGGNYNDYIRKNERKLPFITLIIHGYEVYKETFSEYDNYIQSIAREGQKLGINVIISYISINSVKNRLGQYFQKLIALQLTNDMDYKMFLGCDRSLTHKKNIGRGLVKIEDESYEFQTALITEGDDYDYVQSVCNLVNEKFTNKARNIHSIPNLVKLDVFNEIFYSNENIPVGFDLKNRKIQFYDFNKSIVLPITYKVIDQEKISFINALITSLSNISENKILVFDINRIVKIERNNVEISTIDFVNQFVNFYKSNINEFKYIIFVGMSQEIEIDDKLLKTLESCINNIPAVSNIRCIFIDSASKMTSILSKKFIENVYKKTNGIWLGTDILMQSTFVMSKIDRKDTTIPSDCMSYFINNKNYTVVKHVVENDYE